MKTVLNFKGIQLGDLKIGDMSLEQEYNATEAITLMNAGRKFVKELLKDIPEMLLDIEGAFETVQEIDERHSDVARELFAKLNSEPDREELFKKAQAVAHKMECKKAGMNKPASCARQQRPDNKVEVRVAGPNGEPINPNDLPDEIKSVMNQIIGKIERGEMR